MATAKVDSFPAEEVQLARWAKSMSHPARVGILRYLANHEGCICNDIVDEFPLSQSTISQHLRELREAGLIKGSIDGPRICYCLDEDTLKKCFGMMEALFSKLKCC